MCSHPVAGTDSEIQCRLLCNHWRNTFVLLITGGRARVTAFSLAPVVDWHRAHDFDLSMRTSHERVRARAGQARDSAEHRSHAKIYVYQETSVLVRDLSWHNSGSPNRSTVCRFIIPR